MPATKLTAASKKISSRDRPVATRAGGLAAKLADSEMRLQNVVANAACAAIDLHYSRSGDLSIIYLSDNARRLFALSPDEAVANAHAFLEIFDASERQRFEEAAAVAAAKRSPFNWIGRLRARGKHKARWIRLQSARPNVAAGNVRWQGVIVDATREHELEAALRRSREQLSELSSYLEAGKEEERERIARDIHDELGSLLVALKIESALLTSKLPKNNAALREKARSIEGMLDQAMGTASRVARELRPGILKEFGLAAAIECQAEDFSSRTGITCRAQCSDESLEVEERSALAVFRIVQEALTNVAKHANASLVALRLYRDRQHLIVEIRDNGRGISDADLHKPKSFGLRGIRERVRSLHGELSVSQGEQGGTHIVLSLPLKNSSRAPVEQDIQHKLF